MNKKTLLIDLDGVLNIYTGRYDPDFIPPIRKGAKEFITNLARNYKLILFTTRPIDLAQKWCAENDLLEKFSEITNEKKPAWLLIDDRCINFDGNYDNLTLQILNFTPWYKTQ